MRRTLYIALFLLLTRFAVAATVSVPEYRIADASFKAAVDSALKQSEAPDYLPENWVINGYVYLSADYGWNGMQEPPRLDENTWHVLLMYDGGICASVPGIVNLSGHWLILDVSLLKSGLFEPTGTTCEVVLCQGEEFSCECQYDDVPAFLEYDMPALEGASTVGFVLLGKPVLAELSGKDTIYTEADVMPVFVEGEDSLQRYMDSRRNCLLGEGEEADGEYEVTVSLVVETSGTVRYTRLVNPTGVDWIDRKVLTLFQTNLNHQQFLRWTPGSINGQPVRVRIFKTLRLSRPKSSIPAK